MSIYILFYFLVIVNFSNRHLHFVTPTPPYESVSKKSPAMKKTSDD